MRLLTLKNTAGLIVLTGILTTASCGFDSDDYAIYSTGRRQVTRANVHHSPRSSARVRHYTQPRYNVSRRSRSAPRPRATLRYRRPQRSPSVTLRFRR